MENAQVKEAELTPGMRALLKPELARQGETESDIVAATIQRSTWAFPTVDPGTAWTVWTARRVYFPVGYDGVEWAESVSRNPYEEAPEHHGSD